MGCAITDRDFHLSAAMANTAVPVRIWWLRTWHVHWRTPQGCGTSVLGRACQFLVVSTTPCAVVSHLQLLSWMVLVPVRKGLPDMGIDQGLDSINRIRSAKARISASNLAWR